MKLFLFLLYPFMLFMPWKYRLSLQKIVMKALFLGVCVCECVVVFSETDSLVSRVDDPVSMSVEELQVFDFVNSLRVASSRKAVLFGYELYRAAKDVAFEGRKGVFEVGEAAYGQVFYSAGSCRVEVEGILRNSPGGFWMDEEGRSMAVVVRRDAKTSVCRVMLIVSRREDAAISLQKQQFLPFVEQFYSVPFGYSRDMLAGSLAATPEFSALEREDSAHRVRFVQRVYSLPYENSLQFVFSHALESYQGVHTKELYFKEGSYEQELKRLKSVYETPEKHAPYSVHQLKEDLRYAFWLTRDEFVELRWFHDGGVFIRITDLLFPLRFMERYYGEFALEYPVSRIVFLRLLNIFLSKTDSRYLFDVLHYCAFVFQGARKERHSILGHENSYFRLQSHFNNTLLVRQDLFDEKGQIEQWLFRYKDSRCVGIDVVRNGSSTFYDVDSFLPLEDTGA